MSSTWHPLPFIVHYFIPEPYEAWSNVVHYIGNKVPSGTQNMWVLGKSTYQCPQRNG